MLEAEARNRWWGSLPSDARLLYAPFLGLFLFSTSTALFFREQTSFCRKSNPSTSSIFDTIYNQHSTPCRSLPSTQASSCSGQSRSRRSIHSRYVRSCRPAYCIGNQLANKDQIWITCARWATSLDPLSMPAANDMVSSSLLRCLKHSMRRVPQWPRSTALGSRSSSGNKSSPGTHRPPSPTKQGQQFSGWLQRNSGSSAQPCSSTRRSSST